MSTVTGTTLPAWLNTSLPLSHSIPTLRDAILSHPLTVSPESEHNDALLSRATRGGAVYIPLRKDSKLATGRYSASSATIPGSAPETAYDEHGHLLDSFDPYHPRHAGYYRRIPLTRSYGVKLRSPSLLVLDFDDTTDAAVRGIHNDTFLTYVAATVLSLGIDLAQHPVTVTPHGLHVYLSFSPDYYVRGAQKSWLRCLDHAQGYTAAPTNEEARRYRIGVAASKLSKFSRSFCTAAERALLDDSRLYTSTRELFVGEDGTPSTSSFETNLLDVLDVDFRLPGDARFVVGPGSIVDGHYYTMHAPQRTATLGAEQAQRFTQAFRNSNTRYTYLSRHFADNEDSSRATTRQSSSRGTSTTETSKKRAVRDSQDFSDHVSVFDHDDTSERSEKLSEPRKGTAGKSRTVASQAPVLPASKLSILKNRVRAYRYQVDSHGEPTRVHDSYHSIRASVYCALQCCYDEEAIADVCVLIGADRDTSSGTTIARRDIVADLTRFASKSYLTHHARGHGWLCPRCPAHRVARAVESSSDAAFSPFRVWVKNTRERFVVDVAAVVDRMSHHVKTTTQVFCDALHIVEAWVQTLSNLGVSAIRLSRSHLHSVTGFSSSRIDKAMRLLRRSEVIEILKRPSASGRTTVYRVCDGLKHRGLSAALQLLSSAAVVKVAGTTRFVNPAVIVRRRGEDVDFIRSYDNTIFDPAKLSAHRGYTDAASVQFHGCAGTVRHPSTESTSRFVCSRVCVAEKELFRSGMAELTLSDTSPVSEDVISHAVRPHSASSYQNVVTTRRHVRGARFSRHTVTCRTLGLPHAVSTSLLNSMLRRVVEQSWTAALSSSVSVQRVRSLEKEGYWWLRPQDSVPRRPASASPVRSRV